MRRITDDDIKDDLIRTLAKRCAVCFADSLISGIKRNGSASSYLILNCTPDDDDSLFALFSNAKGTAVGKIKLYGSEVRRALDHPHSLVSAAANFKSSRIAVCVSSPCGAVTDETVAGAYGYLSKQKKVSLEEFIFIGNGRVSSLVFGRRNAKENTR